MKNNKLQVYIKITKKLVVKYFISMILICIFLLSGCSLKKTTSLDEASNYTINENTTASKADALLNGTNNSTEDWKNSETEVDSYNIYGLYSKDNDFDKDISENQIDKDFEKAINQAATTQEFVEVESMYIGKWKVEMQESIALLQKHINETDFNFFMIGQQEWEKQLLDTTKSDYNIILNKNYEIELGSSFHWTWLGYLRLEYRERVIHIKYMIYLLQHRDY